MADGLIRKLENARNSSDVCWDDSSVTSVHVELDDWDEPQPNTPEGRQNMATTLLQWFGLNKVGHQKQGFPLKCRIKSK